MLTKGSLSAHPFELLFGVLAVCAGTALTLGAVAPVSLNATLPALLVRIWGATQLLAGVLIVTGILLRYWRPARLVVGWRLERAGLVPLAAAIAVYGIAALAYAGPRAIYPVSLYAAFAVGCLTRARAIARMERRVLERGADAAG